MRVRLDVLIYWSRCNGKANVMWALVHQKNAVLGKYLACRIHYRCDRSENNFSKLSDWLISNITPQDFWRSESPIPKSGVEASRIRVSLKDKCKLGRRKHLKLGARHFEGTFP